jgi:hypothetical protein
MGARSPEREREEDRGAGDDTACVLEMRMPEGEPQPENPGGPCSRSRCRPHHHRCCRGSSRSWWRGRPEETRAWPLEGEREENRANDNGHSFVAPPPRTATGQQE